MDDNSVCVLIYRHPYLVATGTVVVLFLHY